MDEELTLLEEMEDGESAFTPRKGEALEVVEEKSFPLPYDPFRAYLAEVSKHPLLTREEEFEVSKLVYDCKDREAAQRLVISNLKLVIKIALEYYNTYLSVLDLIQEGNVGLLHAVKKFNPHKGTRFSTYASFWIRAYMLKFIMDSWSLVKVGTTQSQRKLFYRLNKERQKLEALGIYPAAQLLASTLDVKEEEVEDMQKRLTYTDISLETPVSDESDDTVLNMMKSDEDIEEVIGDRENLDIISRKFKEFRRTLNDKEKFIFDRRIVSEEPVTLQVIGDKFQISRERARQLENKVLKKFKERFEGEMENLYF
ncbi:MAG: RNA polymerase factor sigma-32 [Syntrophobacterales bacterium]|jgi:RNA polymerase sigma-32 factor|nr:RNA polymerase factor sigma-32 [Syntrophobacterales bacterium]